MKSRNEDYVIEGVIIKVSPAEKEALEFCKQNLEAKIYEGYFKEGIDSVIGYLRFGSLSSVWPTPAGSIELRKIFSKLDQEQEEQQIYEILMSRATLSAEKKFLVFCRNNKFESYFKSPDPDNKIIPDTYIKALIEDVDFAVSVSSGELMDEFSAIRDEFSAIRKEYVKEYKKYINEEQQLKKEKIEPEVEPEVEPEIKPVFEPEIVVVEQTGSYEDSRYKLTEDDKLVLSKASEKENKVIDFCINNLPKDTKEYFAKGKSDIKQIIGHFKTDVEIYGVLDSLEKEKAVEARKLLSSVDKEYERQERKEQKEQNEQVKKQVITKECVRYRKSVDLIELYINPSAADKETIFNEIVGRLSSEKTYSTMKEALDTPLGVAREKSILVDDSRTHLQSMLIKVEKNYRDTVDKMVIAAGQQEDHLMVKAGHLVEKYNKAKIGYDAQERWKGILPSEDEVRDKLYSDEPILGEFPLKIKALISEINDVSKAIAGVSRVNDKLLTLQKEGEGNLVYYRNQVIAVRESLEEVRPPKIKGEKEYTDLAMIKKDHSSITRHFVEAYHAIMTLGATVILNVVDSIKKRGHFKFWKPKGYDLEHDLKKAEGKLRIENPKKRH
jgi:hypothetical protein